jgi:Mn-dependent DtxR family transcriptional regulator
MSIDAMVLRAMLRLARRREDAAEEAIAVRVGGSSGQIRASLRRLAAGGLVERRTQQGPRLTMAGLAVAVALLPAQRRPRTASARAAERRSRAA